MQQGYNKARSGSRPPRRQQQGLGPLTMSPTMARPWVGHNQQGQDEARRGETIVLSKTTMRLGAVLNQWGTARHELFATIRTMLRVGMA